MVDGPWKWALFCACSVRIASLQFLLRPWCTGVFAIILLLLAQIFMLILSPKHTFKFIFLFMLSHRFTYTCRYPHHVPAIIQIFILILSFKHIKIHFLIHTFTRISVVWRVLFKNLLKILRCLGPSTHGCHAMCENYGEVLGEELVHKLENR